MIIAIDGPAASGKSTVAKIVAENLGYRFISTGAMYRAVTYQAINKKIDIYDEKKTTDLAEKIKISFKKEPDLTEKVFVDNQEITQELFTPKVDSSVSYVSRIPGVRKMMVKQQRKLAKEGNVVLEGRDVGTVVLPKADVKLYLTASAAERARRRKTELDKRGHVCDLQSLKRELVSRDRIDSTRKVSPLIKACDAYLIDTTNKTLDQVVDTAMEIINLSGKK
jgi:cytidylate kinase